MLRKLRLHNHNKHNIGIVISTATRNVSTSSSSSAIISNNNKNNNIAFTLAAQQFIQKKHLALGTGTATKSVTEINQQMMMETPNLREHYKDAVEKRIVGNASLRRLIKNLHTSQYQHAVEAIEGAKLGGLVIDSDTCEIYLSMLLDAGQLKQAMDSYHYMLQNRVCPNTKSYNQLMTLCLEKQSWSSALSLFTEMQRRGRQPDVESYESALTAIALQDPPNWEKAVEIFDKLQRNKSALSSNTYNALMRVYLRMTPFDWRVVYNAYLEMRGQKPHVQFGWNSYDLVSEAMKKGKAGNIRRLLTFMDAWIQITTPLSLQFWKGILSFMLVIFGVRLSIMYGFHMVKEKLMDKQSESDMGFDDPNE